MTNENPTLFIDGQPATESNTSLGRFGKPSAEQAELDSLMNATDENGNLRFTVDPEYRAAIKERSHQLTTAINYSKGLHHEEPQQLYDHRDPMTKFIDNEEMIEFLEAKDTWGNQRMSADPNYRQAVYDYFLRKYPDLAEDYHEVIE